MLPIASSSPECIKWILETKGWKVRSEDDFNWLMERGPAENFITIPKLGDWLALEIALSIAREAGIPGTGEYLALRAEWERQFEPSHPAHPDHKA
ncbi:MAG TPA: hypothetical protein VK914_04275 [bacterium]|jgi:hypothetical protein|nr:hypothetical protein [bacterium]